MDIGGSNEEQDRSELLFRHKSPIIRLLLLGKGGNSVFLLIFAGKKVVPKVKPDTNAAEILEYIGQRNIEHIYCKERLACYGGNHSGWKVYP